MLTPHDMMTLDSIRLHFSAQGMMLWADAMQRAIEALQPYPGHPEAPMPHAKTPTTYAARAESGPEAVEIPGGVLAFSTAPVTFYIDDDRAPGKLMAEAVRKGLMGEALP